ncbi:chromate transporter [Odoribacter sp. Z80]|uniref:chromate transporter n=1 Tax=Odoribacter sp. Z80 TaxID=2304575 RepID=UPI00137A8657|nr:chromate transporter [Odoribacter sp. Z80]NCE73209.1 chromate transporter [Odoribacter sp. Z80]
MYWTLFLTFVKIGMFTIGGGYAMIPLIEREVVNKGWLAKQDFMDLFAVTQSIPGIFAVNISIFVGYKLKKLTGSIICALGTILPSFTIILAIALFFNHFQDNVWVIKIFNGIRPAVVALILVPCINAARSLHLNAIQLIFPAIGALLIWKGGVSPAYIVLAGIIGGLVYSFWIKGKIKKASDLPQK